MKRMEAQTSTQTRIIMDIESRVRRMEDNQRASQAGPKYESSREPREWQVPGRPDFMVSQDLSFQYGHAGGGGRGMIYNEKEVFIYIFKNQYSLIFIGFKRCHA